MFRDIFPTPLLGILSCAHERLFLSTIRALFWMGALPRTSPSIRGRSPPRLQDSFRQLAALGGLLEWRLTASVVFQQPVADLVEIVRQDPKPDVPLKPRPPFVRTAIQPMVFQGIDVRFNRTVLLP